MLQRDLSADDFVWIVGSLCQVNRIPFDAALLLQRVPAPLGRLDVFYSAPPPVTGFAALPGLGVRGTVEGREVTAGRSRQPDEVQPPGVGPPRQQRGGNRLPRVIEPDRGHDLVAGAGLAPKS